MTPTERRRLEARNKAADDIFGHGAHLETAEIEIDDAVEKARDCKLTGSGGAIEDYRFMHFHISIAKRLNNEALEQGLFTEAEHRDNLQKIAEVEKEQSSRFMDAVKRGCSCNRGT